MRAQLGADVLGLTTRNPCLTGGPPGTPRVGSQHLYADGSGLAAGRMGNAERKISAFTCPEKKASRRGEPLLGQAWGNPEDLLWPPAVPVSTVPAGSFCHCGCGAAAGPCSQPLHPGWTHPPYILGINPVSRAVKERGNVNILSVSIFPVQLIRNTPSLSKCIHFFTC